MMVNNIQEIFNPTPEQLQKQIAEHKRIHYGLAVDKGCVTCKHCIHVRDYPGFVTGEECECDIGLTCDTILGSVTNCEKREDGWNDPI